MEANEAPIMDVTSFRRMLYLVWPNESSFETVDEVPHYIGQAVPVFLVLVVIETVISVIKGDDKVRVNDGIASMSAGMFSKVPNLPLKIFAMGMYCWIYNNYRIVELAWNSPYTWYLTFIVVDCMYYWFHRWAHEVNLLWAAHQVHHSSEYYNLTTALRQSVMQRFFSSIVYLPAALCLPPSIFIVHEQFNTLYQFWIHTQYIKHLGPLEWILCTPSHHRVHHGRNRYCIDKNYGGTLIIWDRLFGTFEPEAEEVVYGVTHPINTFDPMETQFCHLKHIGRRIWELSAIPYKIFAVIKGPGWDVGKPWCGDPEDIPDVHAPVEQYNTRIPVWCNVYICVHFLILICAYSVVDPLQQDMEILLVVLVQGGFLISLFSFGLLLDNRSLAPLFELLRCIAVVGVDVTLHKMGYQDMYGRPLWQNLVQYCFMFSAFLWSTYVLGFSVGKSNKSEKKID